MTLKRQSIPVKIILGDNAKEPHPSREIVDRYIHVPWNAGTFLRIYLSFWVDTEWVLFMDDDREPKDKEFVHDALVIARAHSEGITGVIGRRFCKTAPHYREDVFGPCEIVKGLTLLFQRSLLPRVPVAPPLERDMEWVNRADDMHSSIEEAAAMSKSYACCTFRGSVAALDLKTGKLLWKTSMVPEPTKVVREKDSGLKVSGPAGAAIWSAPSLDLKRGLAYVVTGDSYTDVDTVGADAIVALDLKTGAIRWRRQVTQNDNFVMGCGPSSTSGNCPTPMGPDYDFGATPILMTLKGGKQVLVAGQKSGIVYGLDPDKGSLIWKTQVGNGSALGGVEWGIGANDTHVFVPISDLGLLFAEFRPGGPPANMAPAKPGLYALDPANGAIVWATPAPKASCVYASDKGKPSMCARSQSAAPAVIPGLCSKARWTAGSAPMTSRRARSYGRIPPPRAPMTPSTASRASPAAASTAWVRPSPMA